MKIKIGDLTINQTIKICEKYNQRLCKGCPLNDERFNCIAFVHPFTTKVCKLNEREIELSDEESEADEDGK